MATSPSPTPSDRAAQGFFRRLLRPWSAARASQVDQLARLVDEAGERAAQENVRLQKLLYREHEAIRAADTRVSERLGKLTHDTGAGLETLHRKLEQQTGVLGRLVQRFEKVDELELQEARVLRRIDRMGRSTRPILVGPWTGEIGFELLYWIPFVRWAAARMDVDPARLVVVSRGGTAAWYGPLAGRYVDVFDHISADEFREATRTRLKQRGITPLDHQLIRIARGARLGRVDLLHPSLMYDLFYPTWKQVATLSRITDHSRYEKPQAPAALPASLQQRLPEHFVAARFYFSQCFPETDQNRQIAASIVRGLSARIPVVVLGPGMRPDDHGEWEAPAGHRVLSFESEMPPSRNLELQTAILAKSQGFVGTYGGFAYLAPLYGVPAVTFYSQRTFYVHHLELVDALLGPVGGAGLSVLDTSAAGFAAAALSALA